MDSTIAVQDPVDPQAVFRAALTVVGLTPDCQWQQHDYGETQLLMAASDQNAAAVVSVRFAADGTLMPSDPELADPDAFARVMFGTGRHHAADHYALITSLGRWLTGRGLRWAWTLEDDQWVEGNQARLDRGNASGATL